MSPAQSQTPNKPFNASRVHVSNPGVLRKQGNYVVLNIKFGWGLQEGGKNFLPGRIRGVSKMKEEQWNPSPIAREGFPMYFK
jgi:hypothetical protein